MQRDAATIFANLDTQISTIDVHACTPAAAARAAPVNTGEPAPAKGLASLGMDTRTQAAASFHARRPSNIFQQYPQGAAIARSRRHLSNCGSLRAVPSIYLSPPHGTVADGLQEIAS